MQKTTTHTAKAARLLILSRLATGGWLEKMTYQELGDLLGIHRATAYRSVQALREAEAAVPEILEKARIKREQSLPFTRTPVQ